MTDFVCPACGFVFQTKRSLTKHFNRKYSCTPGYTFPDTHVPFNKTCKCKACGKAFSHSSGLYRHRKGCQGAPKSGIQKNNPGSNTNGVVNVDNRQFADNPSDGPNIGLVYLIQPEELLGTDRYKMGCSTKPNISRLKAYKKNSHLLCAYKCTNPFEIEKRLKAAFAAKFPLVAGNEYFQGDENELILEFLRIVYSVVGNINIMRRYKAMDEGKFVDARGTTLKA